VLRGAAARRGGKIDSKRISSKFALSGEDIFNLTSVKFGVTLLIESIWPNLSKFRENKNVVARWSGGRLSIGACSSSL
jgi:hypothetical protein